MKIKKVKWKGHPILKDLELDFWNSTTSQPYDNILFAGENGAGKTTILESLSNFLNHGAFTHFELIEYLVGTDLFTATKSNNVHNPEFYTMSDVSGASTEINYTPLTNANQPKNPNDIRQFGCVFSKARADYKTQPITGTTTKKLDVDKYEVDNEDDFTSLKQLLVDVVSQDNSDFADDHRLNGASAKDWSTFFTTSKLYRFQTAFDQFFENLKYGTVEDIGGIKQIMFKKFGQSVSIDKLSTGEKQIVFRGAYLLKNSKQLDGATIMIDEPELSLHPKWQQKILNFYKNLFTETGVQKTQLFLATHSEHVLKSALENKTTDIIYVLNTGSVALSPKRIDAPAVLPTITNAETNYLAFDVVSNDYHIELYGWLQTKKSLPKIKDCDFYIRSQPEYVPLIHSRPSPGLGTTTYDTLCTFIRNAIDHPDPSRTYSEAQLRTSIELLIELCR